MTQAVHTRDGDASGLDTEFRRGLGLFDSTMVVAGSMIGSGIFIVSAAMARDIGSAGGQYVYLREAYSPLAAFLYGWTLFSVIQTGTVAAVAVGFARFMGVLVPGIAEDRYLIAPIHLSSGYALSLSTGQLVGVLLIALLTWTNTRGLEYGRVVQNVFTTTKTGALLGLIAVTVLFGWNGEAVAANFGDLWTPRGNQPIAEGVSAATAFGLFAALCVAQTGSLFSTDAWNNITFTAGEVKDPRRTIPLALAFGTILVIGIYLLTNIGYLIALPLSAIQQAPSDRVATSALEAVFPGLGAGLMAVAIMVSTFGCNNGLILAGARAYYAMARDKVFFAGAGTLNAARVPAFGLLLQGVWAAALVLPRTYDAESGRYGNLYGNLLDYVVSAALIFYILTIAAVFRLRRTRPHAPRSYRAFGYPVVPGLYIAGAFTVLVMLLVYRPATTWPGFLIVLMGVPVYVLFQRFGSRP